MGEVAKKLAEMVEESGGQAEVAKEIGISRQEVSNTIHGYQKPPRRLLDHFKLEVKIIYVTQGK